MGAGVTGDAQSLRECCRGLGGVAGGRVSISAHSKPLKMFRHVISKEVLVWSDIVTN